MTQFRTFTDAERDALTKHGLATHRPDQLADAFVLGMRYVAQSNAPTDPYADPSKHWQVVREFDLEIMALCDDKQEAEDFIAMLEIVDPEPVHDGEFGIDAPAWWES